MSYARRLGFLAGVGAGTLALVFAPCLSNAAIISGAGTGNITFTSSFFPDPAPPSYTTGTVAFPGTLEHEVFTTGGAAHSYMKINWSFTAADPKVFIPTTLPGANRLELIPSPPVPMHHSAAMTGTFDLDFMLDAAGLSTTLPARTYTIGSYISAIPGSPSVASFEAHWVYTDVGFGPLGSQDITFAAPDGTSPPVSNTVSSLPLSITVPAGHTTLKVSGFFKFSADSDDFLGGGPPFDTLIAVIPEPGSLSLLVIAGAMLLTARRRSLTR